MYSDHGRIVLDVPPASIAPQRPILQCYRCCLLPVLSEKDEYLTLEIDRSSTLFPESESLLHGVERRQSVERTPTERPLLYRKTLCNNIFNPLSLPPFFRMKKKAISRRRRIKNESLRPERKALKVAYMLYQGLRRVNDRKFSFSKINDVIFGQAAYLGKSPHGADLSA
jgi:hypothetical protein